jgi:TatD DNase family protein
MPEETIAKGFISCGIHPWYVQDAEIKLQILKQKIEEKNCIAIGECGLDKLHKATWQQQIEVFKQQIQLANITKKPMIIHCVKASQELIQLLHLHQNKMPIIIHGFIQNANVLEQYLQNNFYISIGTKILMPNSNAQKAIQHIPLTKLFLETDTDTTNSLEQVYTKVAELKNITVQELKHQITQNFNTIFATQ